MNWLCDIERISAAPNVEAVWGVLTDRLSGLGFDRLLYAYTNCKTERSFGDPQDMLILSNHPSRYTRTFVETGLYFDAPMVRWAVENTGACSWRWLHEHGDHLTPAERRVVDFNRAHGVIAGYTLSFPTASRRRLGAIGLTAREGLAQPAVDALWTRKGRDIQALCNVAHLKLTTLPHTGSRRGLTPRQREVLEWVSDGKTTQDVATIMGLTPATIEKHLRLARAALEVETTAQAVMKASVQNQVFLRQA